MAAAFMLERPGIFGSEAPTRSLESDEKAIDHQLRE